MLEVYPTLQIVPFNIQTTLIQIFNFKLGETFYDADAFGYSRADEIANTSEYNRCAGVYTL